MGRNAFKWIVIGRTVERLHFLKTHLSSCTLSRVMSTDIPPLKGRNTSDEAPARKPFLMENSKVYELRQYNCPPGKFPEYLQLTKEYLHLRVKHSKLFGFWTSELGGLNQSVHLWEYDNLDHRAEVRKNLANDSVWKGKYLSKAMPLMTIQDNSVIVPFTWSPVIHPSTNGYYEMQIFNMNDHVEVWHDRLKKAILLRSEALEPLNTKLLGVFYTIFGKQNSVITFWQHESLKKATEGKIRLLNEAKDATMTAFYHEVGMSYSKAMIPFSIDKVN